MAIRLKYGNTNTYLEPLEYLDAYEENMALQSDWNMIMSHTPQVIYYAHANEKRFM